MKNSANSVTLPRRRAAVAVEMAIALPTLILLFVASADFCRGFYHAMAVTNAARAGAIYASDPSTQSQSPFYNAANPDDGIRLAAEADWPFASGLPTVTVSSGGGSTRTVTVSSEFRPLISYTGVPTAVMITRTVKVRIAPPVPTFT